MCFNCLEWLFRLLAERCNCIKEFGYCYNESVIRRLSVMRVYCDKTAEVIASRGFQWHRLALVAPELFYSLRAQWSDNFSWVDFCYVLQLRSSGARCDDPVGEHPARAWMSAEARHVDSFKTPIHEAAETGQLDILRYFVYKVSKRPFVSHFCDKYLFLSYRTHGIEWMNENLYSAL